MGLQPISVPCVGCRFASRCNSRGWFLTFKALSGMGPSYLRNHIFPITSTNYIGSSRRGMFQVPSAKEFHLMGSSQGMFSAVTLNFWNIIVSLISSLLESPNNCFSNNIEHFIGSLHGGYIVFRWMFFNNLGLIFLTTITLF